MYIIYGKHLICKVAEVKFIDVKFGMKIKYPSTSMPPQICTYAYYSMQTTDAVAMYFIFQIFTGIIMSII